MPAAPRALAFASVAFAVVVVALAPACADEELVTLPPEPEPVVEEPVDGVEDPAPHAPTPPADSGADCVDDSDCGGDTVCESGVCVGQGVLRITLTFDMDTDLDLHVITPSGEEVYYGNPAAAGGVLDVDTCVGICDPGTHVENVFFNEALQSGFYEVFVVNYDGRAAGAFQLDVAGAAELSTTGSLSATFGAQSESLEFFLTE
jgi:hypothetical protein